MRGSNYLVFLALICLSLVSSTRALPLVGALPGNFSVDNKGSANYSIPLVIPPGRGGIQPNLALSYNSQAGNGHLGVGWSLSTGFPEAITRGRSILARDGVVRGVNYDGDDKLYLDGKRLILMSGTYGTAGSAYRTEVDSFVTIEATGPHTEIETFVLTDKSGTKFTFGKTATSADGYHIAANETSGKAFRWALKRVEDAIGNAVELKYDDLDFDGSADPSSLGGGEHVVTSLVYTSNLAQTVAAQFEVRLIYGNRDDMSNSFTVGRKTTVTKRIEKVQIFRLAGTALQREYRLSYAYNPILTPYDSVAGESVLKSIALYDAEGTLLLPATTLDYGESSLQFDEPVVVLNASGPAPVDGALSMVAKNPLADFNHDGVVDPIYRYKTTGSPGLCGLRIYLSNSGATSFTAVDVFSSKNWIPEVWAEDFNGDGYKDLVFFAFERSASVIHDGGWYVSLYTPGGGFAEPVKIIDEIDADGLTAYRSGASIVCDLDGDGRADILTTYNAYLYPRISMRASPNFPFYAFAAGPNANAFAVSAQQAWDDFMSQQIADGGPVDYSIPDDYLKIYKNTTLPTGSVSVTAVSNPIVGGTDFLFPFAEVGLSLADYNGDGLTDIRFTKGGAEILYPESSYPRDISLYANHTILLNQGDFKFALKGSETENYNCTQPGEMPGMMLLEGDFNGDGATDLMRFAWALDPVDEYFADFNPGPGWTAWRPGISQGTGAFDWQAYGEIPTTVSRTGTNIQTFQATVGGWYHNSEGGPCFTEFNPTFIKGFSFHDVNRDGMDDLVWLSVTNESGVEHKRIYCVLSKGDHFDTQNVMKLVDSAVGFSGETLSWGDFNGDGIDDLVDVTLNTVRVALSHASADYKLLRVTNGLGQKTEIAYKPGTDASVYTPGVSTQYPIASVASRALVVSDVWQDSGADGQPAQFSYQYSGRRLDLSGRGDLGFHSFITLDRQTNLFKYQFLAQSFPMTGLIHREETYRYLADRDFNLISSHDNTVVFDKVANSGGATLWPFISKAVEYRWEDGAGHVTLDPDGANLSSDPENLLLQPKPAGAHVIITATSVFDNQAGPQLTLPSNVSGYNPSDMDGAEQNAPVGTSSFATFSGLPGKITNGNLIQLATDFGDGFTETVATAYKPPVGTLTGLVASVTTTVTSPVGGTEVAPVKRYNYWNGTPLVADEVIDATDDALDLKTTYTRDVLGRVTDTTISNTTATGDQAIGSYSIGQVNHFDAGFDLPTATTDNYGHTAAIEYHSFFGLPVSVTDVNGSQTTTHYDDLGRATQVRDELKGLETNTVFAWDSSTVVAPPVGVVGLTLTSAYSVTSTTTVQPEVTTWYDRLGRPIRTIKTGFNDQQTITDTIYNVLGQVVATSNPFHKWTTATYDALGRVAVTTSPNGLVTSNSYAGRATRVTVDVPQPSGPGSPRTTTTVVDAKGRTVKVWNADDVPTLADNMGTTATGASIAFGIDGFGRMRTTTLLGQSQQITATYDALGHQTTLNDPDKGPWSYLNNALGQVVRQTDAKSNVTTSAFDRLGRPLARVTTGGGVTETAGFYYYDTETNASDPSLHLVAQGSKGWIGVPQREEANTTGTSGFNAPATVNLHYYDDKGRPSLELAQLDGQWFYTYSDYDVYSRVNQVRHYWRPAGHESASDEPYLWQDFGYTCAYDAKSYLLSLTDSLGRSWWDNPNYDLLDRVTSVRKGSGHYTQRIYQPEDGTLTAIMTGPRIGSSQIQNLSFQFDEFGNLKNRSDGSNSETFGYDILNRVFKGSTHLTYAANGNITSKTDLLGHGSGPYTYDGVAPHAVTSAWGYNMTYDANGNLETRSKAGETWSLNWTGFDKPRWMAKTTGSATVGSEFHYNAARSRVMQLEFDAMSGGIPSHYNRKRLYGLGSTLEANYTNLAATGAPNWSLDTVRIYVPGPDGIVGAREFSPLKPSSQQEKAFVYHYDHLGSIQSITAFGSNSVDLATDNGGRTGLYSEDAWGQRRNPLNWGAGAPRLNTDDGGADSITPRGFTGHEMLDDLGLVHMNGRIYDPLLGRFLSADILVQAPDSLQSYNRYSYVSNNPLRAIDPSGFTEKSAVNEFFSGLVTWFQNWDLFSHAGSDETDIQSQQSDRIDALPGGAKMDALILVSKEAKAFEPGVAGGAAKAASNMVTSTAKLAGSGSPLTDFVTRPLLENVQAEFNARIDEAVTDRIVAIGGNPSGIGRGVGEGFGEAGFQLGLTAAFELSAAALELRGAALTEQFAAESEFVNLANKARTEHILDGEVLPNGRFSGGHRWGTGFPGKSEFPATWSDNEIMHHISDVATDPLSTTRPGRAGNIFLQGARKGVDIEVLVRNNKIWTGYPTNVLRNP